MANDNVVISVSGRNDMMVSNNSSGSVLSVIDLVIELNIGMVEDRVLGEIGNGVCTE